MLHHRALNSRLLPVACVGVLLLAGTVHAADALAVSKLEQDVLELQRQLRTQERRVEALERQLAGQSRPAPGTVAGASSGTTRAPSTDWLDNASWDRIRIGMPLLEVLAILGTPTSLRNDPEPDRRVLYYALEIGTGNFLVGTVSVAGQQVVAVQKPMFR